VNALSDAGMMWSAAQSNHAEVVEALLEAGANPSLPDGTVKETPLCAAASDGAADAVKALISGGADLDAVWIGGV
jgi:ankyrin repeat protein